MTHVNNERSAGTNLEKKEKFETMAGDMVSSHSGRKTMESMAWKSGIELEDIGMWGLWAAHGVILRYIDQAYEITDEWGRIVFDFIRRGGRGQ